MTHYYNEYLSNANMDMKFNNIIVIRERSRNNQKKIIHGRLGNITAINGTEMVRITVSNPIYKVLLQ